ncbi:hypothetical protein ACIQZB_42565 [Streptomyces sp. NPDC097727]|uniref:hypothetical protein n=1 Tax=Streptomyces sp. NPDC097727 TaxID=3366092 RepID=UPI003803BA31
MKSPTFPSNSTNSPPSCTGAARLIQHLLAVAVDYRNGVFAGTNGLVKTIGGSDPLDVEGFIAPAEPDIEPCQICTPQTGLVDG